LPGRILPGRILPGRILPGRIMMNRLRALVAPRLARLAGQGESRKALGATLVTLVLKLGTALCIFLFMLLVSRWFGAVGAGVIAIATTIRAIAGVLGGLGLDMTITRTVASRTAREDGQQVRADVATASLAVLLWSALICLPVAWAAPHLARSFGNAPDLAFSIALLAGTAPALLLARIYAGSLRGLRRFITGNGVDPFAPAALVLVLMLVLPMNSIRDVGIAYAAAGILSALGGWILWLRLAPAAGPERKATPLVPTIREGLPVFGTLLGGFLTPWVVILAMGLFSTTAETGIYRVVAQFALLLGFILQASENGLGPQYASLKAQGRLEAIAPAARRTSLLLCGVLPGIAILILARPLLNLFGPDFTSGVTALRILVGAQIIVTALGPVGQLMIMAGLERYSLANSIAGATLVILLSLLLIPTLGATGAALAAGATLVIRAIVATAIVWQKLGLFLPLGLVRTS
jgi:O-antigen/teichoic acid export membrane protein